MQSDLRHVYWMGGSPCSGKSSMADLLGERFGWQVYHCDTAFNEHVRRARPDQHPWLCRVPRLVWDEFWMRPLDVQLRNVIEGYAEEFPMILDDLRLLPDDRPVLAEGTALLPELVAGCLTKTHQAIWVVPTPAFQREQYPKRGDWVQSILNQCRQPETALHNWMARDIATAEYVRREAEMRTLSILTVDGSRTIADNAQIVADYFGGALNL